MNDDRIMHVQKIWEAEMMMKRILRLVCGAIIVLVLVNLITEFSVNDTLIGVVKDNVIYKATGFGNIF